MADHKSAGAVAESKSKKSTLPQTGERKSDLSILAGSMAMLLGLASLFIGRKKKKDEN
ncbi:LPXTG cell wall anchor domain-containing protein [Lactobacillus pasteurii]|nr:LPXTG cell wall anchor domain-containing protein [Lactobacillus pasteurii]